jgi:hypothetical protein
MNERLYVEDLAGNPVDDPEGVLDGAVGLRSESQWPGGYSICTFRVRRRNLFAVWAIRESYTLLVQDGTTIVWQGRITAIRRSVQGVEEVATIEVVGPQVFLNERLIRAYWWYEIVPVRDLEWEAGRDTVEEQRTFVTNHDENVAEWLFGTGDVNRVDGDYHGVEFFMPKDFGYEQYVKSLDYDWKYRTNETAELITRNVDQAGNEDANQPGAQVNEATGSKSITFSLGDTKSFQWRIAAGATDTYDQNDYFHVIDAVVKAKYQAGHPQKGSEAYTQNELVIEVLLMINAKSRVLSNDTDRINGPEQEMSPYAVYDPVPARQVIDELLRYGDDQGRYYGLAVWSREDTSDDLPRVEVKRRDVSKADYFVRLDDDGVRQFSYELADNQLFNWVAVGYTDKRNILIYRTPTDNAGLKNQASIDAEYQREKLVGVGVADSAIADRMGVRYIDYHKDRQPKTGLAITDFIQDATNSPVPVNRIRAGDTVQVAELDEIFFIRHVSYDAETQTARLSFDQQQDGLAQMMATRRRQRALNRD